jgi:protein-disulfide isomerase
LTNTPTKPDLKRVSHKLNAGAGSTKAGLMRLAEKLSIPPHHMTRRNAIIGGVGVLALAAASAWYLNASGTSKAARKGKLTEISIEELMKPGPLPDMQIGKPDAPVTIVEYASMTCGHCAHFHNTVYPVLKAKYIDTGKARLIMREFPLDDRATGAAMLARCTGEGKTYPLVSALFARQEDWAFVDKDSFVPALSRFARQAGFTEDSMRACLKDQALMDKILTARKRAAEEFGVNSTPTFFINGKKLGGGAAIEDFDKALEPLLKS